MNLHALLKSKLSLPYLAILHSARSFYSKRYSDFMLDKSSFLARVSTISILSVCFGSVALQCRSRLQLSSSPWHLAAGVGEALAAHQLNNR